MRKQNHVWYSFGKEGARACVRININLNNNNNDDDNNDNNCYWCHFFLCFTSVYRPHIINSNKLSPLYLLFFFKKLKAAEARCRSYGKTVHAIFLRNEEREREKKKYFAFNCCFLRHVCARSMFHLFM